jgi:hypothetical protein
MIRTQVYLTPQQVQEIRLLAASTKKRQAEVIRDVIQAGLKNQTMGQRGSAKGLLALAELGRKLKVQGPGDLSTNHDAYLYDD